MSRYLVAWVDFTGMQRMYFSDKAQAIAKFTELDERNLSPFFYEMDI